MRSGHPKEMAVRGILLGQMTWICLAQLVNCFGSYIKKCFGTNRTRHIISQMTQREIWGLERKDQR